MRVSLLAIDATLRHMPPVYSIRYVMLLRRLGLLEMLPFIIVSCRHAAAA